MPTGGGLHAAEVNDDTKLNADKNNPNRYTYEFNTGDEVKTELGKTKLTDENKIKHLAIKAGANQSGELKFTGDAAQKASLGGGYSFDLTADKLTFTGIANQEAASIIATNGASTINAKNGVELSNANIDVANGAYFNRNLNGSLA
ncbi:TPA: hypothetical protein RTH03_000104 [Campylobacter jejuni]|nr:hypothetical protein [Campylobacter jejuni]HDZ5091304.1 hypothetical protein [Campylobacter jejuni]